MSCTMKEQLLITSLLLFHVLHFCTSTDIITSNQSIKDGDLIVSEGNNFALGFFSTSNSSRRYIGIWYNKVSEQTVVWVANRDNPINGYAGVLSIDNTGNLVIRDGDSAIPVWSTNVSAVAGKATFSAQLLDTGNLVLFKGETKSDFAWQSFDYPTNTMLPYMKLGVDRRTGLNRFLTSWKSIDDPRIGEYSFKLDLNGSPQFFLNKGSTRLLRSGPWNWLKFIGVLELTTDFIFNLSYVNDHNEVTSMYTLRNESIFSRFVVNESGVVERLTWQDENRRWVGFWTAPKDSCDYYNHCGVYGNCNPQHDLGDKFECTCLPGFEPRLVRDWHLRDGSGGCKRKRGEGNMCRNGEGFVKLENANLPDISGARVDMSLGWKECEELCLGSCNCTGYARADLKVGGIGCITWYGELVDTKMVSDGGQDIYIRVDAAELAQYSKSKGFHGKKLVAIMVTSVAAASIFIVFLTYWLVMKKRKGLELDEGGKNTDLPSFDLSTLIAATNNFSAANELGGGGFGTVYKGRLYNGVEIAVKRLSKSSGQGIEEFKNEVTLIAKLQHRNLVGLLGYCFQQEEKMLIYEYLPNKGLDYFIFDKVRGSQLDWKKRFQIILGIARGIIYLHQDSRLRIIHRDLKASNILLDAAMNPKISDFGMARMFGGDQIEANTRKVVGTYGYMSPEYAMQGLFSIKSDVFSFGVLLLEIISGKKNISYYQTNSVNLIGHVWELWKEGNALDIVDSSLEKSHKAEEVVRCIQIGLLCVQEIATDRPNMSEVAFMLCNETALLDPKQPAFIFRGSIDAKDSSVGVCSVNDVTVTMVEAR